VQWSLRRKLIVPNRRIIGPHAHATFIVALITVKVFDHWHWHTCWWETVATSEVVTKGEILGAFRVYLSPFQMEQSKMIEILIWGRPSRLRYPCTQGHLAAVPLLGRTRRGSDEIHQAQALQILTICIISFSLRKTDRADSLFSAGAT
jgi:hypothetical protein